MGPPSKLDWTPQRLDEEHGAAPWTTSTESCVHVTPGGVATEEDVRAPRRPHNWSSELLWPYWKATEERPTTPSEESGSTSSLNSSSSPQASSP